METFKITVSTTKELKQYKALALNRGFKLLADHKNEFTAQDEKGYIRVAISK